MTTFVYQKPSEETLNNPTGIVMNHKGNFFFVSNCDSHTILKITTSGMAIHYSSLILITLTHCQGNVSVFAGSGQLGSNDGVRRRASFKCPRGLAIDQEAGTLFVSGLDDKIRQITREGEFALFLSLHNTC